MNNNNMLNMYIKGMGSVTLVLLVLGVTTLPIMWFQAEGDPQDFTDNIMQQRDIEAIEQRFENTVNYLEESLYITGMRSTDETGTRSGRENVTEDRYRYWMCDGETQIPPREKIRNTSSEIIDENMEQRIMEISGIRRGVIHNVGETKCIETGIPEQPSEISSDRFKIAMNIDDVTVSEREGHASHSKSNLNLSSELSYNKFWPFYERLREWVENEDFTEEIEQELANVPNQVQYYNQQCSGCDPSMNIEPHICENHEEKLQNAVETGIEKEVQRLEEEYFEGNATCNAVVDQDNYCANLSYSEGSVSQNVKTKTIMVPAPCPEPEEDESEGGESEEPEEEESENGEPGSPEEEEPEEPEEPDPDPDPPGEINYGHEGDIVRVGGHGENLEFVSYECTEPKPVPRECPYEGQSGNYYHCYYNYNIHQTVNVDYLVSCRDDEYRAVPGDADKDPLEWEIMINYEVEHPGGTQTYDEDYCNLKEIGEFEDWCPDEQEHCTVDEEVDQVDLCETGVEVVE